MGILNRVFEARGDVKWNDLWSGSLNPFSIPIKSSAGVPVDNETAMRCTSVYACVKVLGESVGSLPIHMLERKDRGRDRATDHWGYNLMHRQTGPRTPARQWVETAVFHMVLSGNHYSVIDWNNAGGVTQLFPLNPNRVEIERAGPGFRYKYQDTGGKEYVYDEAQMLHIPAFSWDGISGISPIGYNREMIGLAVATEEFGSRFFSSGTNMGTIYTQPEGARLTVDQTDKLTEDLQAKHAGLGKAHKALILPAGITAKNSGIPPNDAQWLDSRKLNKAEIASIFRVPLFMIQEHEKNTSWGTGIENMNLGFIQHTLRPWLVRIEQMLSLKLLNGNERDRFYFEFLPEALLRGDMKSSGEYFQVMLQNQVMTPNEVREKLNMNPLEGGDEVIKQENIFGKSQDPPADENGQDGGQKTEDKSANPCDCGTSHGQDDGHSLRAEPDPELDSPRMSIQRSYRRVIRDAMSRVIRRERNDIMAAIPKQMRKKLRKGETRTIGALEDFIAEFYRDHEEFTREAITPAFTALSEAIGAEAMRELGQSWEWNDELEEWLESYIGAFANRHSNQSRGQLLQMLEELEAEGTTTPDEVVVAFGERFENWEAGIDGGLTRDDKIGARESVRLGNGFAAVAFFAAGVLTLVWRATGSETCPYCVSLNGRTVGRNDVFLTAGQAFQPKGADTPLNPISDVKHPPAHAGCDCIVMPGG